MFAGGDAFTSVSFERDGWREVPHTGLQFLIPRAAVNHFNPVVMSMHVNNVCFLPENVSRVDPKTAVLC